MYSLLYNRFYVIRALKLYLREMSQFYRLPFAINCRYFFARRYLQIYKFCFSYFVIAMCEILLLFMTLNMFWSTARRAFYARKYNMSYNPIILQLYSLLETFWFLYFYRIIEYLNLLLKISIPLWNITTQKITI